MFEKLFFDKQDYALITLVNKILTQKESSSTERIFDANLHPHGIKTLMLSHEMRVAHAVARLLTSLEHTEGERANSQADAVPKKMNECTQEGSLRRLSALRTLYNEVLASAQTSFRRNTARVLIQIMKGIVRAHGDMRQQLLLAHDFRRTAHGSPRVVRQQLQKYGLVEMPEDWSQLAFDHHVHDSSSKGRKNPTQLIMDAWIKGIRHLTIIYYNYIEPHIAREALHAADIMGVDVLIGIEFTIPFEDKFIQVVWAVRDFADIDSYLQFLSEAPVRHIMELGREASNFRAQTVFRALHHWNEVYRSGIAENLPPIIHDDFAQYVGTGQVTPPHLASCVYEHIKQHVPPAQIPSEWSSPQAVAEHLLTSNLDAFWTRWTHEHAGGCVKTQTPDKCPEIMRHSPADFLEWLSMLHSKYFMILHLANLTAEDVLSFLWHCKGRITHLEIFNFKVWEEGRLTHLQHITELLHTINSKSLPRLKYFVLHMLENLEADEHNAKDTQDIQTRRATLREILQNIQKFKNFYSKYPLRTRMGTDTTSSLGSHRDMGLVLPETLPPRAQKTLEKWQRLSEKEHLCAHIPLHIEVQYQVRYSPKRLVPQRSTLTRFFRALPGLKYYGFRKEQEWYTRSAQTSFMGHEREKRHTNIAPLSPADTHIKQEHTNKIKYLNTRVSNALKVLAGFIPAAIAFQYTQSWWVLAWFGPVIWFAITGGRNILQAVMAGGGRSTLLRWKDYVSWSRLCDSLMYTGFSVPLLEWGVRIWLLEKNLGFTVTEQTVLVYTVMSVVNGLYISWHNFVRGLPKEAIIGNLFRSALAIPLSMLYNSLVLEALLVLNVHDPYVILQTSAAIISKTASDTIAAIIEGHADRNNNRRIRHWDYEGKLQHVFHTYAQLEMLFPEENIVALLSKPRRLLQRLEEKEKALKIAIIINALDLMYFWLYRPRGQDAFRHILQKMSKEERVIIGRFQLVLMQEREVSQLFVDGMTGRNFGSALALYLDKYQGYLKNVLPLCAIKPTEQDEM